MKRIKSAPANLVLMSNNKKKEICNNKSIFNIPFLNKDNNIKNSNLNIEYNTNIKRFSNFKNLKYYTSKLGNLISDIINDSNLFSLEESTLLSMILTYSSENIFKRDKLKEVFNFTLQSLVKYLFLMFIHTNILHDKIDNNLLLLIHYLDIK